VVLPATLGAVEPEVWQYQLLLGAHAISAWESDDARKLARNTAAVMKNIRLAYFPVFHSFL
jgi:hypothetical protein